MVDEKALPTNFGGGVGEAVEGRALPCRGLADKSDKGVSRHRELESESGPESRPKRFSTLRHSLGGGGSRNIAFYCIPAALTGLELH